MVPQAMQIWSNQYVYIYIICTPRKTKKNDVFEVATLLGQITLFSWSASGEYHIYIYTHMCVLIVVLLLNSGTYSNFVTKSVCKRLHTRLAQDSRFKIKKNILNPETLLILAPGFKKFFLDFESWILNPEPVSFANAFGDKIALSTWPSMLAGHHSAMLSDTACTWNSKGVASDMFNENTRYLKDILKIYIYILIYYIDSWPDWNIKGVASDMFNENTRYLQDILKIDIYICILIYYIDSWPDWNITVILKVY